MRISSFLTTPLPAELCAVRDAINAIEHDRSRPPGQPDVPERSRTPTPRFKHVRYLSRGREYEPLPSLEERTEMFKESIRRLIHHAWKFALFPHIWQGRGQQIRRLGYRYPSRQDGGCSHFVCLAAALGGVGSDAEMLSEQRGYVFGAISGGHDRPVFHQQVRPTLQQLSMKTIGHQELSQNFQLLGVFPRLAKLTIVMPLDHYHLQDPTGFRRLLKSHPQLRELCIKYARCCRDCVQDGFDTYEGKHKFVVRQLGTANSLYYNLAQMGSELTSLTLTDRNLTLEEVKTLLGLFPSYRLKKLSFFAKVLSPRLIDAIAQACPSLSSLSLDVETVSSQDPCTETYMNPDVEGFSKALYNYGVDRQNDRWRYRAWTLSDVSVMRWELKVGHQYNWACMQAIAAVVPSVRSFAGRGHMEAENDLKVGGGGQRHPLDT
ncbi:hypothetical protein CPB84DRAFT_1769453 [Gymnopilus junonius]|uniref:Uncharacterized protein n=1 Tax=Gymnopilus junonius TaxID=109634 RepID=A0A9P5NSJ2_GYMJU|nr:hypothetical protein CPB84DRAFT_1769453 [Gymnopilus junonius]